MIFATPEQTEDDADDAQTWSMFLLRDMRGTRLAKKQKQKQKDVTEIGLLIVGGCIFFTGMAFTLPDSSARYAYVFFGLLAVPVSFLWSAFAFITGESKKGKWLSLTTIVVSGVITFIGILKII